MAEKITVHIHGSEYNLRGEDASRVRAAADLVNERMRDVAGKSPTQSPATVAVLAALNTAEELLNERERSQLETQQLLQRIEALNASIDKLIGTDTSQSAA